MRLFDLLKLSNAKYSDRIAVKDDVCEITYSQLMANVKQMSDYLRSVGCGPGVKIAIVLPNSTGEF